MELHSFQVHEPEWTVVTTLEVEEAFMHIEPPPKKTGYIATSTQKQKNEATTNHTQHENNPKSCKTV